jgi:hypothetical protein
MTGVDGITRYTGERQAAIAAWLDKNMETTTVFKMTAD